MTITELLQTTDCGTWAAEFVRFKNENKWTLEDIDEGLMQGWFANAMCAASDPRDREIEELSRAYNRVVEMIGKLDRATYDIRQFLEHRDEERESIEIDLPEDKMLELMLMAHENNITFNQLCEGILQDYIARLEEPEEEEEE